MELGSRHRGTGGSESLRAALAGALCEQPAWSRRGLGRPRSAPRLARRSGSVSAAGALRPLCWGSHGLGEKPLTEIASRRDGRDRSSARHRSPARPRSGHRSVAVLDREPAFRLGMETALRAAGFSVVGPDGLSRATTRAPVHLLVSLHPSSEAEQLGSWAQRISGSVIAILDLVTSERAAHALRRGASGVVERTAHPEHVIEVLRATLEGFTVLPLAVARELAVALSPLPGDLAADERVFLGGVAAGVSMEELADDLACSVRTLYRRQRSLYRRLGIRSRAEAIALAMAWGLGSTERDDGSRLPRSAWQ